MSDSERETRGVLYICDEHCNDCEDAMKLFAPMPFDPTSVRSSDGGAHPAYISPTGQHKWVDAIRRELTRLSEEYERRHSRKASCE